MESINPLHLHCSLQDHSFDIDFQPIAGEADLNTVVIDGRSYRVECDEKTLAWLHEKLPRLRDSEGMSIISLQNRLKDLSCTELTIVPNITNSTFFYSLQPVKKIVDHAYSFLFSSRQPIPSRDKLDALLKENHEKLQLAGVIPIPTVHFHDRPRLRDDDLVDFPPILKGLTQREVLLLGTIASIWGENSYLEQRCLDSARENDVGEYLAIDGERRLFYQPFGDPSTSKACLIIQSGAGCTGDGWMEVERDLGELTYGISYDRASFGNSDPVEDHGSALRTLDDLNVMVTLLEQQKKLYPPYILVGHSLGGALMQLYGHNHPEKVRGVILVDSTAEGHLSDPRIPQEHSLPQFHGFPPSHLIPLTTARALFPQASHELASIEEQKMIPLTMELLAKAHGDGKKMLYDLPLCVIHRGQFLAEGQMELTEEQQAALEIQQELTLRSTRGERIACKEGIGHFIHRDSPEVVAQAIRDMIKASIMQE